MKFALLDTNFILTCIKQKIDFFEELKFIGLGILIPAQVIRELKNLKIQEAEFALKILEKNKNDFKEIDIGNGHVDKKIKFFAEKNPEILVATLDKELQKKLKNKKIIIRGKKKLEII